MAIVRCKLGMDDGTLIPESPDGDPMLAELIEELRIRRLIGSGDSGPACDLAQARLQRLEGTSRAWARLNAQLLLVECLAAAGRQEDARPVLSAAIETCEEKGLVRPILDSGEPVRELVGTL